MKKAVASKQIDGIKELNDLFKDGYEVESVDDNGIYILNKIEILKARAIDSDMKVELHLDTSGADERLKELSNSIKQVREGINKEETIKPISDKRTQRAVELVSRSAEKIANLSDGLTAVSRDKSNHELEQMINVLSNKIDSVDCKASAVNANMSAKQSVLESKVKKYDFLADTPTPHIRIEFYDTCDVPKVWVDGKRDYKYMNTHIIPILDTTKLSITQGEKS